MDERLQNLNRKSPGYGKEYESNTSTNIADYKIGSMNIGWEVPGLSSVSAQVKGLSLVATGPKANK